MVFPKKLHLNLIFLVLLGKIFLFPEKKNLFFRRKREDELSKKIHGNMLFFFKRSDKMVFPKTNCTRI